MEDNDMPILLSYEPEDFWQRMKDLIHTELTWVLKNINIIPAMHITGLTEKPLYKIIDLCKIFQVSRPTIYEWIKAGKLKPVKIKSRVYFLAKDIKELIQPNK